MILALHAQRESISPSDSADVVSEVVELIETYCATLAVDKVRGVVARVCDRLRALEDRLSKDVCCTFALWLYRMCGVASYACPQATSAHDVRHVWRVCVCMCVLI